MSFEISDSPKEFLNEQLTIYTKGMFHKHKDVVWDEITLTELKGFFYNFYYHISGIKKITPISFQFILTE